jgi:hypothetical protein
MDQRAIELENNVEAISRDLVGKEKWKTRSKEDLRTKISDLTSALEERMEREVQEVTDRYKNRYKIDVGELESFSPDMVSPSYHPPIICMSVATTAALLQPRQARYISPSSFHYCLLTVISGAWNYFRT